MPEDFKCSAAYLSSDFAYGDRADKSFPILPYLSGEKEEEHFRECMRGLDGQIKEATMRVAGAKYDSTAKFGL